MMSRFKLYTKEKKIYQYLTIGLVTALCIGAAGYGIHAIGTVRAKSRETVLIYTEEEFEQYLTDRESEEYNLDGRYRLEENLDLSWLESSIGTDIEPFTGSFDGNGHRISGLERPLFGVMKDAKVEQLFLSEAQICHPAVYSDGQCYVDGYAALAAYAANSVIKNCGMSGEIQTSSPSESEYQMAKASPSEADDGRGSGFEGQKPAEGEVGPGVETGPEEEITGPGRETETLGGAEGPGCETENAGDIEGPGGEPGTAGTIEGPWDETGTAGTIEGPGGEPGTAGTIEGLEDETGTAGTIEGAGDETETAGSIEGSGGETEEVEDISPGPDDTSGGIESTDNKEGESGNSTNGTEEGTPGTTEGNTAVQTKESMEGRDEESLKGNTAGESENNSIVPMETVGYRSVNRDHLMLKISAVTDLDAESTFTATPSDATPSDAENVPESGGSLEPGNGSQAETKEPEESPEYIGNPNGDIYILVTAERVTAGGLVAETSGNTRISDSFTLVTLCSKLEDIETYSGGFAGILGMETRIENSYATGLADSDGVTGGFAAGNEGFLENCYSTVTVGEDGIIRGAFTAVGDGTVSGCIYDRQMACVTEEETAGVNSMATPSEGERNPENGLRGLNTIDMTGPAPLVPGTWHTADQAYPQIPYFAAHEDETIAANSSVSAIPLILPEGVTLVNALNEGDILLPGEIEGQEVQWEAEGAIRIDENKRIVTEAGVTRSRHEAPEVGTSLDDQIDSGEIPSSETNLEETGLEEVNTEETNTENTEKADVQEEPTQTNRITASLGGVNKSFSIGAVMQNRTVTYTTWIQVGEELTQNGEITPPYGTTKILPPQQDAAGCYEIYNATQLAWYSYNHRYTPDFTGNVRLKADVDLFGSEYTNCSYDVSADNIKEALLWTPMLPFSMLFDGENHVINHLYVNRLLDSASSGHLGFIEVCDGGTIKNLGFAGGLIESIEHAGSRVGTLAGNAADSTIYNCWSNVDLLIRGKAAEGLGGIIGLVSGRNDTVIDGCGYFGEIKDESTVANHVGTGRVGGIVGVNDDYYTYGAKLTTLRNCYNRGTLTSLNTTAVGGIVAHVGPRGSRIEISNCYNAGSLSGTTRVSGILGYNQGNSTVSNAYCDKQYVSDSKATALDEAAMKSWAFAYALNGQSMNGMWAYTPGQYPGFGTLARPESWQVVGQGVLDGLVASGNLTTGEGNAGSPYEISTAEQLAVFALKVNSGETALCGLLKVNIDLTGIRYSGTLEEPIPWIPIGVGGNIFSGTIDGSGKIIGGMKVKTTGPAGLIGHGEGMVLRKIGLDSTCSIEGGTSISPEMDGTAAFVGVGGGTIQSCYSRAEIHGKDSGTGTFVGINRVANEIKNCYAAGRITISTAGVKPGAMVGKGTAGTVQISFCYWDEQMENGYSGGLSPVSEKGSSAVTVTDSGKQTTAYMKSDALVGKLNQSLSPVDWERDDGQNNKYPVLIGQTVYADWAGIGAASAEPETAGTGEKGTASNPYLINTAEELAWFAYQVNEVSGKTGICGKLTADISLFGGLYTGGNGYDTNDNEILARALKWIPIGSDSEGKRYTGVFDGNGHVISKMRVKGTEKQGLFGTLGTNADIRKTGVRTSLMEADTQYAGGIAGCINGADVSVTGCYVSGSITVQADGFGGIVGGIGQGDISGSRIDGCYVSENAVIDASGRAGVGGILGESSDGMQPITVRNCYNAGKVTGERNIGGIAGYIGSGSGTIINSYNRGAISGNADTTGQIAGQCVTGAVLNCFYEAASATDLQAVSLEAVKLKTWGAAWKLNGESLNQSTGISWNQEAEKNSGYPYPVYGSLKDAPSWEAVGEAASNGLLAGAAPEITGTTYQIGTAEQLAWFAYQVNHVSGRTGICGDLTADINMQAAESRYISGNTASRLNWVPIGKGDSEAFEGVFGQGHQRVYEIQNLYVNVYNRGGLFGSIYVNGKVMNTGLSGCSVTVGSEHGVTPTAGGIAGRLNNNAAISHCYNRGGSMVTTNGTSYGYAGGIAGIMNERSTIEDSYHLDSTVVCNGGTNTYAGGITGLVEYTGSETVTVRNSYNACGPGGSITASNGANIGGITGGISRSAVLVECYSEELIGYDLSSGVILLGTTDENRQSNVDGLNTLGSSVRRGIDRVWYTSLADEETRGLPTLEAPVMLEVSLNPADNSTGRTEPLSQTISGAVYRGVRQENGAGQDGTSPVFDITESGTVSSNFKIYGSENANRYLGLKAGNADLGSMTSSLTRPTASAGDISQITLFNGAAYTCPDTRAILMDFAVGNQRYEVRAEVAGESGKILSIILPTKVYIDISPDGTAKTSHSLDVKLVNENDYPVEGSIKNLVPMPGDGYVKLQPVKQGVDWTGKTGQITEMGVKLGIDHLRSGTADGTGLSPSAVYYTPKDGAGAEDSWLNCRLKSEGTLWYQYFMEYAADPYYEKNFTDYGYTVEYQFSVAEKDYTADVHAEIIP